jgi:hypothetical protein
MWRRVNLVWTDVSEEYRLHLQGRKLLERGTRVQSAATCSRWFLAGRFFYPEDGGDTFLRNVGSHKIYTAPHPTRRHSTNSFWFTVCFLIHRNSNMYCRNNKTFTERVPKQRKDWNLCFSREHRFSTCVLCRFSVHCGLDVCLLQKHFFCVLSVLCWSLLTEMNAKIHDI